MECETQNVVIIDDEPTTLLLLEHAIAPIATVSVCEQSTHAQQLIKDKQPDLILLDINMPGMSGFELCERLKSSPETANIPVIFITSHSDVDNERSALNLGAIDFIS